MSTPSAGHKFETATKAGEPVGSTAGPNWERIEHVVECPLCRYNLRGLSEPMCPECGCSFAWPEILDITRRKHRYLFEHHPERNVWSFFKTLIGGLNPWSFWRRLHPAQRADETRLTAYRWVIKTIAGVPLAVTGVWLLMMAMDWPIYDWPRRSYFYFVDPFPDRKATILSELLNPFLHARLYIFMLMMTLFLFALPEMSTATLLIYRTSMRQAKIQKHHVDRCVAYSYDVLVWPIAGMLLLGAYILLWQVPITNWEPWLLTWCLLLLLPGIWLLMSIRLACAYRYYLRMKHAVAAVAAGQVIVALVIVLVLMVMKELMLPV